MMKSWRLLPVIENVAHAPVIDSTASTFAVSATSTSVIMYVASFLAHEHVDLTSALNTASAPMIDNSTSLSPRHSVSVVIDQKSFAKIGHEMMFDDLSKWVDLKRMDVSRGR